MSIEILRDEYKKSFTANAIDPDQLNKAIKYINELEKQRQWIKVSDRLPELPIEDGKSYLTYPHYRVLDFHDNNFYEYNYDLECEALRKDITHWMPLPEPPEGE